MQAESWSTRTTPRRRILPVLGAVAVAAVAIVAARVIWPTRPGPRAVARTSRADALELAKRGPSPAAEAALRRHLDASDAPDPEAAEALARLCLAGYNLAGALDAAARWARDAPGDPRPWAFRGEVTARTAEPAALVVDEYREAVGRGPSDPAARFGLADSLRLALRPAEAAPEYDAYLKIRPDDPAGHRGAGRVALDLGDEEGAARHLDRALALTPDDAVALLHRAGVDLRRGDALAALARLDRAAKVAPFEPEIHYHRSLALARAGRVGEALAEQEAATRLRLDNERLIAITDGMIKAPNDSAKLLEGARWLIDHGRAQDGARWLERIVRTHPRHPEACRLLAEHHAKLGNPGLANYYRTQAP